MYWLIATLVATSSRLNTAHGLPWSSHMAEPTALSGVPAMVGPGSLRVIHRIFLA